MKLYWYRQCPKCKQGRLFIFSDLDKDECYLHCEECETGWRDPEVLDLENSFLTLLEEFESEPTSKEYIAKKGWLKYAINEIEE
jgi:hypothetical protein